MKSFVIISVLAATAAMAQSSSASAAAPASTANPYIPSGISADCISFLTTLNSDTTLSSCTAPLITATANFGPGASSTSSPSNSAISSALDGVCASTACSPQTLRGTLSDFYSACSAELTSSPNADVMRTYDVFYSLTPFTQALCAKNGDGAYCATKATSSSSSAVNNNVDAVVAPDSSASSLKQFLWSTTGSSSAKRATAETAAIIPNVTTYRDSNLLFFFLQPDTPSATLCTPCARSAMLSYMQFEASVPYAPGLVNSVLMGGQSALYTAMNTTCGATFFTGGVSAVGGIASGMLGGSGTSAAPRTIGQNAGVTVALLAGAAVFAGFML